MKYDIPLTTWIRIGLLKDTLQQAIENIHSGKPISPPTNEETGGNLDFINKILREEVLKQFDHKQRPLLEVVLNGIDARPPDEYDYNIDVNLGWTKFVTRDNGKSMSLEQILTLLIIPFNTEKTGIEEIGRFGVGFLSTFKYALDWPRRGKVTVITNTGKERYSITFSAYGNDIKDLHMEISNLGKMSKKRGTTVQIRMKAENKKDLVKYLKSHLTTIPSYKARIQINGGEVNCQDTAKWYDVPVSLTIRNEKIVQPLALKIVESKQIGLTSQGVMVNTHPSEKYGAVVSFPSAVLLVEGRNQFKKDANYDICIKAAFEALEKYINDNELTNKFINHVLELIPDLAAAFGIRDLKSIPSIERLCEILLPNKKYVVTEFWYKQFLKFVGEGVSEIAFQATPKARSHWGAVYGDESAMIQDLLPVKETMQSFNYFDRKAYSLQKEYINMHGIAEAMYTPNQVGNKFHEINLVELPKLGGECLMAAKVGDKNILWLNRNHPYFSGEKIDPAKTYAAVSELLQDSAVRDVLKIGLMDIPKRIDALSINLTGDKSAYQVKEEGEK